jgi:hypothetical protein
MTSLLCSARGCTCRASMTLIAGFVTARGKYLCKNHWLQLRNTSSVEAECYTPLNDHQFTERERRAAA